MKKSLICPRCGSKKIKFIIYGFPDPTKIKKDEILAVARLKKILLNIIV